MEQNMKQKYPYQLANGDKVEISGKTLTVEGVEMLAQKVCKVHFIEGVAILIPFIRKVTVTSLLLLTISGCSDISFAYSIEGYPINIWANAIYKAENSKTHPYGIMAKYRTTTPRNACINTLKHQYKNWCKLPKRNLPFIAYLAEHYAPLNVANDPTGLNINWTRNVQYFLNRRTEEKTNV